MKAVYGLSTRKMARLPSMKLPMQTIAASSIWRALSVIPRLSSTWNGRFATSITKCAAPAFGSERWSGTIPGSSRVPCRSRRDPKINTPWHEFSAAFSGDGRTFYYASSTTPSAFGDYDLWQVSIVPEPTTLTMLGLGVASFLGFAWNRRKREHGRKVDGGD